MVDNELFENKARELDNMIHGLIGKFDQFLPKSINELPLFQNFQEHLMYVIMSFLQKENTGEEPQELFIQIPISKYSNVYDPTGDNLQKETFQKTNGTVLSCLLLSTIDSIFNNARVPEELKNEMANWNEIDNIDKLGSAIYGVIDDEPHVIEFKKWQEKRPKVDLIYTCSPLDKGTYWGYKTKYSRKILKPNKLRDSILLKRNGRYVESRVIAEVEKLKRIAISSNVIKQYAKTALVHVGRYEPLNENILIKSNYFNLVPTFNSIDNLSMSLGRREMMDVIIVVGDDRYKNRRQSFKDCAGKKIIYIGTESPGEDIPVYSFSYREMYRYCSPDGSRFEEPNLVRNIQFPWMDDALSSLRELLDSLSQNDEDLTEDVKRSIIRLFRLRFSNIAFNHHSWEEQKNDIDIDVDCDSDTIDSIMEWCEGLDYSEESNPKVDFIRAMEDQPTLVFGKYWSKHLRFDDSTNSYLQDRNVNSSYRREFKQLTNVHNHIVIDSASYGGGMNDAPIYKAYSHLLKYHLYPHVTALYYENEENYAKGLLWFLNKEFDCYNSEKRLAFETAIISNGIKDDVNIDISEQIFTLEDFMDINDSSDVWGETESRQTVVTFSDGHQDRVDGEVLLVTDNGYSRVKIQSLEDKNFDQEEIEVIFYNTPKDFEKYMRAYYNFSEGDDIHHYELLWKRALRIFISRGDRQELVDKLSRNTNISPVIIKRYFNEGCPNKFLGSRRAMRGLCDYLSSDGLIQQYDVQKVIAAKNAHDSYKKNGKILKREVLAYKIDSGTRTPMISIISKRINVEVDDIVNSCLSDGIISSIDIY